MDQVQGIAGYVNTQLGGYKSTLLSGIWFVVWRPRRLWITRVQVDIDYFQEWMFPALKRFYFRQLLPAFTHRHNGLLQRGQIVPGEVVQIEM
jgi:hypothetical protein